MIQGQKFEPINAKDLALCVNLVRRFEREKQQITVLDLQRVIHKNYEYSKHVLEFVQKTGL